ncbi:hypothetical protein ACO0SA_001516 [Hanseniaspora valbyensis]
MSEESNVSFFTKHKTAIITTVCCLSAVVSAAYVVYSKENTIGSTSSTSSTTTTTSSASTPSSSTTDKKKKKKEAQKLKKQHEKEEFIATHSVDKFGLKFLPNSTAIDTSGLTAAQKTKKAAAIKTEANEIFKKQNYEEALVYYTWALQLSNDPIFYSNRSVCHLKLNQPEKCIKDCTSALEIDPTYTKCLLRRAQTYETIGKYEEAILDLTGLSLMKYNAVSVEQLLQKCQELSLEKDFQNSMLNQKHELVNFSDISSFYQSITSLPKNSKKINDEKLNKLVDLIYGDSVESIKKADDYANELIANDGAALDTQSDEAKAVIYAAAASLTFFKSLPTKSLELVEKSLTFGKNAFNLLIYSLIMCETTGMPKESSELFNKAIEADLEDASALYHKAQFLALVDDSQIKAICNLFIQVLEIDESFIFAEIQLCLLDYKQNPDKKDYQTRFTNLIRKYPDVAQVRMCYAEVLSTQEDQLAEACAQLDKILDNKNISALEKVNAMILRIHFYLSDPEQTMANLTFANTLIKDAYEIDPTNYKVLNCIGQLTLQDPNKIEEGMSYLQKALENTQAPLEKKQLIQLIQSTKIQHQLLQHPVYAPLFIEMIQQAGM